MTFSPKALFYFVGFLGAVVLALNAQEGAVVPWLGIVGMAAIVLVDWVLTFWPTLIGRSRRPDHRSLS